MGMVASDNQSTIISTRFTGYITAKDLGNAMKAFGQVPTEAELQDMLNQFDSHRDGAVDFQDFLKFVARRMEELREAFRGSDLNRDGFISVDELRRVLTTLWGKLTDEEADELICAADVDGDGKINHEEFLGFMMTDWPSGSNPYLSSHEWVKNGAVLTSSAGVTTAFCVGTVLFLVSSLPLHVSFAFA